MFFWTGFSTWIELSLLQSWKKPYFSAVGSRFASVPSFGLMVSRFHRSRVSFIWVQVLDTDQMISLKKAAVDMAVAAKKACGDSPRLQSGSAYSVHIDVPLYGRPPCGISLRLSSSASTGIGPCMDYWVCLRAFISGLFRKLCVPNQNQTTYVPHYDWLHEVRDRHFVPVMLRYQPLARHFGSKTCLPINFRAFNYLGISPWATRGHKMEINASLHM